MQESTTIAISKKTKLKLIEIKGNLDKETGKIHSMNAIIEKLIKKYQPKKNLGGKMKDGT